MWHHSQCCPSELAQAYVTLDADATYHLPGGRVSLSAYVRNAGDKAVYSNATMQPLSGGSMLFTTINAPRTYGLRASINF